MEKRSYEGKRLEKQVLTKSGLKKKSNVREEEQKTGLELSELRMYTTKREYRTEERIKGEGPVLVLLVSFLFLDLHLFRVSKSKVVRIESKTLKNKLGRGEFSSFHTGCPHGTRTRIVSCLVVSWCADKKDHVLRKNHKGEMR